MDAGDSYAKLASLSQRERDVLRRKCDGLDYKTIGQELNIAVPTVKADMGRVYVKLNLDQLSQAERLRQLFETYCPALRDAGLPPGPPELVQPPPLPKYVQQIVDDDERAVVIWQPRSPAVIETRPIRIEEDKGRQRRPRPLRWMVFGMILGILLIAAILIGLGLGGSGGGGRGEGQAQATTVVQVTQIVPVSPTPAPAQPTATPMVVVATATPPPAPTEPQASPTPTQPPDTPADAILETGEWWKQNGVWLRLNKVDFGTGDMVFYLDLWNQTGDQLLFEWTVTGNFSLRDNTSHVYRLEEASDRERYEANELSPLGQRPFVSTFLVPDTYFFDPSVTDLYLTVTNLTRISHAEFHVKVPK